jgi:hypothetical protein
MQVTRKTMLSLPRPTDAQWAAFEEFLPGDHSWYKSSLFKGVTFVVYLSPDAGHAWDLELARNAGKSKQLYRQKHGHLAYGWSFNSEDGFKGEGIDVALGLPLDLIRRCSFRLYPWGASDGAGLEVIGGMCHEALYGEWTKLEAGADHPYRERLFRLRRQYEEDEEKAWALYNEMSNEETAKVGRALRELRQWLYAE